MRRFVIATMFVLAAAVVADNQSNNARSTDAGAASSTSDAGLTKTTAAQDAAVEKNADLAREG